MIPDGVLHVTKASHSDVRSALQAVQRDIDLVRTAQIRLDTPLTFKAMGRTFFVRDDVTVGMPSLTVSSYFEKSTAPDEPVLSVSAPFRARRDGKPIELDALLALRHARKALELLLDPDLVRAADAARTRLEEVGMALAARIEAEPPAVCVGRSMSETWLDHPGPSGRPELSVLLDKNRTMIQKSWTIVSEGVDLAPAIDGVPRVDMVWIEDKSIATTPVGENAWKIEIRPLPVIHLLEDDPVSTIRALRLDVPQIAWSPPRPRNPS